MPPDASNAAVLFLWGIAWLVSAAMTGALVAVIARRIHPSLSFFRLWRFYSILIAATVLALMGVAWF